MLDALNPMIRLTESEISWRVSGLQIEAKLDRTFRVRNGAPKHRYRSCLCRSSKLNCCLHGVQLAESWRSAGGDSQRVPEIAR